MLGKQIGFYRGDEFHLPTYELNIKTALLLMPELTKTNNGEYLAVHMGKPVAIARDQKELSDRLQEQGINGSTTLRAKITPLPKSKKIPVAHMGGPRVRYSKTKPFYTFSFYFLPCQS